MVTNENPRLHESRIILKVLGWMGIAMSAVTLAVAILIMVSGADVANFGIRNLDTVRAQFSDDMIRLIYGSVGILSSVIGVLVSWLMIKAANPPYKTTAALVFVIFALVASVYSLFSNGFQSGELGNIFTVTVYILALIALLTLRNYADK